MKPSPSKFFASVRAQQLFGSSLSQAEVDGCEAILDAFGEAPLSWLSYGLATGYKETAHMMQPISEFGGDAYFFRRYDPRGNNPRVAAELGNTQPGDGVRFHGRGYVQLTGRLNYARAGAELNVDLLGSPERALEPLIAAEVMDAGMREGWFTGRGFKYALPRDDTPASFDQFRASRSIINGHDCEEEIARYAGQFQSALQA